jgi:hypothetical protein
MFGAFTATVNQPVPPTLNVGNITVTSEDNFCYNATQAITVGGASGTFIVQAGGMATMIAGNNIVFQPGTMIEPGGHLDGHVTSNGQYCIMPSNPPGSTGISDKETIIDQGMVTSSAWPNPTTGEFTLALNGGTDAENVHIDVYSMHGALIHTGRYEGTGSFNLSVSGHKAGIYLIRVIDGNNATTLRLVKQ